MRRYTLNWDYTYPNFTIDIAKDINDILEEEEFENEDQVIDFLLEEIDNHLIYYKDQWDMLKAYCNPRVADFDEALFELTTDIENMLIEI